MVEETSESVFTLTALFGLTGLLGIFISARMATKRLMPADAKWLDKATFLWMVFDAAIHVIFDGSWLYLSTFGRQVATSRGPFADVWKEYAKADTKWGVADPTIVSLEILIVLGTGPMTAYVAYLILNNDPARHFWLIIISTAELFGNFMTFGPSWLEGSPSLDTSNWLFLWVYLFMNILWVIFPLGLLYTSYNAIATSLRLTQAQAMRAKKA